MKKKEKKGFVRLLICLLLAIELAVLADFAAAWLGYTLPLLWWGVGALVVFLLLFLLPFSRRRLWEDVLGLVILAAVVLLGSFGFLSYRSRAAVAPAVDSGKRALYGGHTVLVAAPRPGDELPLAGGVMEGFLRYGSELYLLFTDAPEDTEPAAAAAARLGLSADHILSASSSDAAEALAEAMLRLRPDLVLGAEADSRGTVLERALATVRAKAPDYAPLLLRGLPAGAEESASPAFYLENLPSTEKPAAVSLTDAAWDARLRLPTDSAALSRSMLSASTYAQLLCYGQSYARGERILRGDRVFWPVGDSGAEGSGPDFVKIADSEGNFIYDYYIDPRGKAELCLYTAGDADQPYSVSLEGERCLAKLGQERSLSITCPKGRRCIVTVTSADGAYWDTVVISNPGRFARTTAPAIERTLLHLQRDILPETNSFRLCTLALQKLRP